MKILIAASTMGHIENFHMPYIEEMKKEGHLVKTLTGSQTSDIWVKLVKKTFSFTNFLAMPRIRKALKKGKYDIVFVHTSLAAFVVRMAMKGMKKRPYVVNTVHGYLFGKDSGKIHNKIYLFCEKFLKKQTDNIIVMNGEDYDIATKHKLCKGEVYFSNGMGVKFKEKVEETVQPQREMKSLLFVGEVSRRKNQGFLIDAMKKLDGCTLTLIGTAKGDYSEEIKEKIKKEGLTNRVEFIGYTDKVYEYIKGCDVYVSASKIEGLPFNIMEAMYMKKPIVASDVKGHCDLLDKDSLYPLGDIDKFVSLVKKALGKKTVEYDIEKYGFDRVFYENMALYRSLMENKQPMVVKEQP